LLAANICSGQKEIIFRGGASVEKEPVDGILKQLQLNFDYSITMSFSSSWDVRPNYYILGKKGDSLTAWRYNKQVSGRSRGGIKPDTSLHKVEIERPKLDSLLGVILKNDLANVPNEAKDTYGCGFGGEKYVIDDAGAIKYILITKQEYRVITFYAPEFFEEKCPGSSARQIVIACAQAFRKTFERVE